MPTLDFWEGWFQEQTLIYSKHANSNLLKYLIYQWKLARDGQLHSTDQYTLIEQLATPVCTLILMDQKYKNQLEWPNPGAKASPEIELFELWELTYWDYRGHVSALQHYKYTNMHPPFPNVLGGGENISPMLMLNSLRYASL